MTKVGYVFICLIATCINFSVNYIFLYFVNFYIHKRYCLLVSFSLTSRSSLHLHTYYFVIWIRHIFLVLCILIFLCFSFLQKLLIFIYSLPLYKVRVRGFDPPENPCITLQSAVYHRGSAFMNSATLISGSTAVLIYWFFFFLL